MLRYPVSFHPITISICSVTILGFALIYRYPFVLDYFWHKRDRIESSYDRASGSEKKRILAECKAIVHRYVSDEKLAYANEYLFGRCPDGTYKMKDYTCSNRISVCKPEHYRGGRFLEAYPVLRPNQFKNFAQTKTFHGYRLVWLRSFGHPVVVELHKQTNDKWNMMVRQGDGKDSRLGEFNINIATNLSFKDLRPLQKQVRRSGLWFMKKLDPMHFGYDGDILYLEVVKNGRYKAIERWSPNTLSRFGKIVREILRLAEKEVQREYNNTKTLTLSNYL